MVHIHSKKFLCCLPVRIGVFFLSGASLVLGGLSAVYIWYIVVRAKQNGIQENGQIPTIPTNASADDVKAALDKVYLDKTQFTAFIIAGVVASLTALFSLFGLIGTIFRRRALVAMYSTILWIFLVVHLAVGSFYIYSVIKYRNQTADECNKQTNGQYQDACKVATKWVIGIYIAVLAIFWLIEFYCCIIVKRYVEQLGEEQAFKSHTGGNKTHNYGGGGSTSYYPHQPLNSGAHELMPAPGGHYPYNSPAHSFGNKA
ncbi:hypothetical protein FRC03_008759 [Tulasnella sp. 419]|nr:hypothetical protein FRC02_004457 [Tulasnella sp. 418]KAG8968060.1 hypothetical protein FRC03_008759 [Tulasnella sp. 419]